MKAITQEIRDELRKPLPPEAVKQHPTKTYLSSIKAIYVIERLNDVFGIGKWNYTQKIIERVAGGVVVVEVNLIIPEYGIDLTSFGGNDNGGEASKNFDLGDAYKGAVTDAITKICSMLEIGIDVFKGLQTGKGGGEKDTAIYAPENAPWLNDIQYNKALQDINNGEKGLFDKLCTEFRMKKVFREGLQAAEKNPIGKMPDPEKPNEETDKVKPTILPNTDGWYKTVVWLAAYDGFFLDAIDKVKANYTISDENIEKIEKEAQILMKKKVTEPTTEEKAKNITKKGKASKETVTA